MGDRRRADLCGMQLLPCGPAGQAAGPERDCLDIVCPDGVADWLSQLHLLDLRSIGQNTVVQIVESPSGKYYAQVIDSDQGALGGDTLVDVDEKSGINVILFKIEKKPQRVYSGDWGECNDMQIDWKDDDCLIIHSTEYQIR